MERKYVQTFFSTETGGEYVMNIFLANAGNDELRSLILFKNQELWRPIRPQVATWLRAHFRIWKREKPAWLTDALCRSIPTDMLPLRDSRGSSVHDASLAMRLSLSLGVRVPEVTLPQVMPHAGAPDSETRGDGESSESDSEADFETQQLAGTSAA